MKQKLLLNKKEILIFIIFACIPLILIAYKNPSLIFILLVVLLLALSIIKIGHKSTSIKILKIIKENFSNNTQRGKKNHKQQPKDQKIIWDYLKKDFWKDLILSGPLISALYILIFKRGFDAIIEFQLLMFWSMGDALYLVRKLIFSRIIGNNRTDEEKRIIRKLFILLFANILAIFILISFTTTKIFTPFR